MQILALLQVAEKRARRVALFPDGKRSPEKSGGPNRLSATSELAWISGPDLKEA
jgi:hypothetical protein